MLVRGAGRQTELRNVSLIDAVESQTNVIGDLLTRVAEQLMAAELGHRRRFRESPLRATLQGTLGYALEKLSQGLRELESKPLADPDSVSAVLADLDFVIDRLRTRLDGSQTTWNEQDDEVYQFFLAGKLEELERMASEIDAEYQSDQI